jgi:UPF0755 protein
VKRPFPRWLLLTPPLGLLLAAAAFGALWLRALAPAQAEGPVRLFTVPPGATLRVVAEELEREGLVRRATALVWLARVRGLEGALRAGEYELSATLPAGQILRHLTEGHIKTHEIVLPEGLTAAETAARLESTGLAEAGSFLAVVHDAALAEELGVEGPSLEGYLFPETYQLPRGLPPRELAEVFVRQFLEIWGGIEPLAATGGLSMREIVTLASIVEKETGTPEERPLIASVFHNRLRRGMRLESDPTVIYGIANFDGNLRRAHLEDRTNPYNTYRIRGLPPTPIANPGQGALRAVVEPADTAYLYFVSRNDGTHIFSASYRAHQAAVNRYQKRRPRR